MLGRTLADIRTSFRTLLKQPRFTVVAALTLALGIGAVTLIFSVVNGVLLQPLRYPHPDRLVNIWSTAPGLGYDQFPLSPDLFMFYRRNSTAFEDMGLFQQDRDNLAHEGDPEVVQSAVTTASFFSTLGGSFTLGRPYRADEDTPEAPRVAVISTRLWDRAFHHDPQVVGRVVRVDGQPTEIVGVAPEWLNRPNGPDLWRPARFKPDAPPAGAFGWNVIGRLKPGITPDEAATQLEPLVKRAMETIDSANYRAFLTDGRYRPLVHPMKEDIVGDVREPLWILLGTVAMVLLIACANVANLSLVRAEGRQREIALRLALGGSRAVLARSLLIEALVLSSIGAAIGVGAAALALPGLISLATASIPRLNEVGLNGSVIVVAAGAAILSALIFGIVPALRYTRSSVLGALRQGGRGSTDHPSRHRGRLILVAAQTALAMILLVGSGLLARSFSRLMATEPGFTPAGTLSVRIALPTTSYPDRPAMLRFTHDLVQRLDDLPSIEAAGATSALPMGESAAGTAFEFEGRPAEPGKLPPIVTFITVTPGYFSTVRTRLVRGRDITWDDTREGVSNVIVNQAAADKFWPGDDPVGKRIRRLEGTVVKAPPWFTVVGVVRSVRQNGLREAPPALFYFPPVPGVDEGPRVMSYVVRGGNAANETDAIRRTVRAIDADVSIAAVQTLEEVVSRSVVQFSFTMLTLAIAAAVALILGAVGLYSVLSYAVTLQTREIGVRLALGAPPSRVMRTIVVRGFITSAIGLGVGAAGAAALTRLLRSLLFETTPLDPVTFGATAAMLMLVALAASYLPARRAASINPMESMRGE